MTLLDLQPNLIKTFPDIVTPVATPLATPLTFFPTVSAEVDKTKLLDYYLSKAQDDNAPEYLYGTKQEARYTNPYLQYTPNAQGAYSSEDIYAKYQGSGEKLLNAIIKTGATAGTTFVSTFAGIPNQIDAIRQGKVTELFDENTTLGSAQKWLENLENKYPNYYSQWETDHPYLSALPFSGGAVNFWGDKILKNAVFTIGGLAAAVTVDAAIEFATAGTATPATLILAGKQLSNAIKPLKNIFRSLSKVSVLNKVDDVYGLARTSGNMIDGIKAANSTYNLKKAGQFAVTLYSSTQGEAMIEGYHTYIDTKTKLLEQVVNEGKELTPELFASIEENASYAGRDDTIINMALLSASNLIQFPKIIGWVGKSDILKKVETPFLEIVKNQGLEVANNWTRKAAVKNILKDTVLKGVLPEGFEEGSQYYVGNSLHDYYVDKFNGKAKDGMVDYLLKAVPKTLNDSQFWQESFLGALSGGLMGAVIPGGEVQNSIKTNSKAFNSRHQASIQKTLDTFNNSVKDLTHLGELIEQETNGTNTEKFQTAYKSLFSTVRDSAKYGVLDSLKENLEDLRTLPVEEYNKLFYQDHQNNPNVLRTEREKFTALDKISTEIDNIENDLVQIEKFYPNNPFTSNKVKERIKSKFKVDDTQVKTIQEKLFNDFKENTAYQLGRLRNTAGRIGDIKNELRLGVPITDENFAQTYATLTNLVDEKAVKQYLRFKDIQLETIKGQKDYYEKLGQPQQVAELNLTIKRIESLKKNLVGKNEEELSNLILEEEMGVGQAQAIRIMEQFREAQQQEEILANTKVELETATNEPEIIAQAQVDFVATTQEDTEETIEPAPIPQPVQQKPDRISFGKVQAFEVGQTFVLDESPFLTKEFAVVSKNDSQVIVKGEDGKDYLFTSYNIREVNPIEGEGSVVYYESFFNFSPVLKGKEVIEEEATGRNLIEKDRNRLKNKLTRLLSDKQTTNQIGDGTYIIPGVQIDSDRQGWYYLEYRFRYNKDGKNYFEKVKVYLDKKIPVSTVSFKEGKNFISLSEQPVIQSRTPVIQDTNIPDKINLLYGEVVEDKSVEDKEDLTGRIRIVNGEIVEKNVEPGRIRIVNGEIVEEVFKKTLNKTTNQNIIEFMKGKENMQELFNVLSGAVELNQISIVC